MNDNLVPNNNVNEGEILNNSPIVEDQQVNDINNMKPVNSPVVPEPIELLDANDTPRNSEERKKNIIILILAVLIVGGVLASVFVFAKSKTNVGGTQVKSSNSNSSMVLEKEERFVNNKLAETITYKYNDYGLVESMDFDNDTDDYDLQAFLGAFSAGSFKYKYELDNNKLKKMVAIDAFSEEGVSFNFNDDLTVKVKYGYDNLFLQTEDKSVEVKYTYDSKGHLIKRVGYDNPYCMVDQFETCGEDDKPKQSSEVTFMYENDNLVEEVITLANGTKYIDSYEYDDHNNVKKFVGKYTIKREDNIFVDSDTYQGTQDYDGSLVINYDYTYNKDGLIDTVKAYIELNNNDSAYISKRKYNDDKKLIFESLDELVVDYKNEGGDPDMGAANWVKVGEHTGSNIYTRKLSYKSINFDKSNIEYLEKANALQTATYSLLDYIHMEDYWLSFYSFDI